MSSNTSFLVTICSAWLVAVFGGVERTVFLLVALEVSAQGVAEEGGMAAVTRSSVEGNGTGGLAGSSSVFCFFFFS